MAWLQKVVFPLRRVWLSVSGRVKPRKNGAGLLKLRNDIQTCGYEDVQVMWEMLRKTEAEIMSHQMKHRNRPFWRLFILSNNATTSASSFPSSNPAL